MDSIESPTECPALLLSIKQVHANRIFEGVKHFELRKALPKQPFCRVYLYESGGAGIVGCFDVGGIVHKPVEALWEEVGESATSKQRFFDYFNDWDKGYAIGVKNPIRFERPIFPAELRKRVPDFSPPQSYGVIWPHQSLYRILERHRVDQQKSRSVTLSPVKKDEESLFIEVVTTEIAPKYAGITTAFAESILETHRLGHDPNGILTTKKEVFSIRNEGKELIGFTTLTYKYGGCAKTGPTVLLRRYRSKGYGGSTRAAIESLAKMKGIRKLYCTCPDNDPKVLNYLLSAGFRVEAHLDEQYHEDHGELVLGRMLVPPQVSSPGHERLPAIPCKVVAAADIVRSELTTGLRRLVDTRFLGVPRDRIASIAKKAIAKGASTLEQKPVHLLAIAGKEGFRGCVILVPKRGGALKAMLLVSTSHQQSIEKAIIAAEEYGRESGQKKIYYVHPIDDPVVVALLRARGYIVEGVLREPYQVGRDNAVLSRLLKDQSE